MRNGFPPLDIGNDPVALCRVFPYRCNFCQFPTEQTILDTFVLWVVSAQALGSVENNSAPALRMADLQAFIKRRRVQQRVPREERESTFMKRLLATVVLALTLFPAVALAQAIIRVGPPPPIVERPGPVPGPRYVWVPGYQRWNGHGLYLGSRTLCDPSSSRCRLGPRPLCPASRRIHFCCRSLALIEAKAIRSRARQLEHRLDLRSICNSRVNFPDSKSTRPMKAFGAELEGPVSMAPRQK